MFFTFCYVRFACDLHFFLSLATGLEVRGPQQSVTALVREDILLPCYLVPNSSAESMVVTWKLNNTGRLVHLYKDGRDMNDQQYPDYRGRTTLSKVALHNGNASLKLANVQISDHGDYTCLIQDGSWRHQLTMHVEVKGRKYMPLTY